MTPKDLMAFHAIQSKKTIPGMTRQLELEDNPSLANPEEINALAAWWEANKAEVVAERLIYQAKSTSKEQVIWQAVASMACGANGRVKRTLAFLLARRVPWEDAMEISKMHAPIKDVLLDVAGISVLIKDCYFRDRRIPPTKRWNSVGVPFQTPKGTQIVDKMVRWFKSHGHDPVGWINHRASVPTDLRWLGSAAKHADLDGSVSGLRRWRLEWVEV